jgi:hypothetical protein
MMHGQTQIKLILCSITFFFRKSCRWGDNMEKYGAAEKATDDNMAHAHFMLNN